MFIGLLWPPNMSRPYASAKIKQIRGKEEQSASFLSLSTIFRRLMQYFFRRDNGHQAKSNNPYYNTEEVCPLDENTPQWIVVDK
jgi:hypothetical protein